MKSYEEYPMEGKASSIEGTTYSIEDVLALAGELAFKYTSGESSSVSWERAQILAGAVIYCLEEYRRERMCPSDKVRKEGSMAAGSKNNLPVSFEKLNVREAYMAGSAIVQRRVKETKELYHRIIRHFEDYRCENYRSTILKGIPAFFMHYDPRFEPQNRIVMLDYPCMQPLGELEGVDAVQQYLKRIWLEQQFLNAFEPKAVEGLLLDISPEYEELFLDNICREVIVRTVLCMAAERPAGRLQLEQGDMMRVKEFFPEQDKKALLRKIRLLLKQLFNHVFGGERAVDGLEEYCMLAAEDCAVRISLL